MNNLGSSMDLSGLDLSKAFQMDGNSMDLSGMVNLDQVEINMGNMPQMNLGDILTNLDVQVNADGMQKMLISLSEGYQEYVKSHPEADYSNLGNQIAEYLTSDQAKAIIQKYLKDILKNNGEVTITPEQIKELLTSVMSDFQSWLVEQNANPGAEEFGTYFQQYLQTGRANAIVNKWANEIFGDIDFNISSDTLQAMAKELADGYGVEKIVLGYPKNMNNTEGERCEKTKEFKGMLEKRCGLPVVLWDERLTTVAADRSMMETGIRRENRKDYVDEIAAVFILQGYLDYLSNHPQEK